MSYEKNVYNICICKHQQSQEIEHYQLTEGPIHPIPCASPLSLYMYSYMYMCIYLH